MYYETMKQASKSDKIGMHFRIPPERDRVTLAAVDAEGDRVAEGAGVAAALFYELLDQAAPRAAWAEGAELEMNLRQSGNVLHVTLINPDLQATVKATIRLAARYQKAVDRGVEGGFPVPLREKGVEVRPAGAIRGFPVPRREKGSGQAFDIWLAPGEGTMVDLF